MEKKREISIAIMATILFLQLVGTTTSGIVSKVAGELAKALQTQAHVVVYPTAGGEYVANGE